MRKGSACHCAMCDQTFYKQRAEQDSEKSFCSKPCYMGWRAVNRSGATYPKVGPDHRHRLVATQHLGRPLAPGEVVHHIDEDRLNFAPENLAVFPDQATHMRCHRGGMSTDELNTYRLVRRAEAVA